MRTVFGSICNHRVSCKQTILKPLLANRQFNFKYSTLNPQLPRKVQQCRINNHSEKPFEVPSIKETFQGPQANKENDSRVEKFCNAGIRAKEENDYASAYNYFTKAIEISGTDSPRAYGLRADLLQIMEKFDDAVSDYKSLLAILPNHVPTYVSMAMCNLKMGKLESAMNEFNQTIAYYPEYTPSYVGRAECYRQMQRFKEAIDDYEHVMRKDDKSIPKLPIMLNLANCKLFETKLDDALEIYRSITKEYPDNADGWIGYGNTFYQKNEFAGAVYAFTKALNLNCQTQSIVLIYRASCLINISKYEEAVRDCNEAEKINGKSNREISFFRGQALYKICEFTRAIKDLSFYLDNCDSEILDVARRNVELVLDHNGQVFAAYITRAVCLIMWYLDEEDTRLGTNMTERILNDDYLDLWQSGSSKPVDIFVKLHNLSQSCNEDKRLQNAFEDLKKAKIRFSSNPSTYHVASMLLRTFELKSNLNVSKFKNASFITKKN